MGYEHDHPGGLDGQPVSMTARSAVWPGNTARRESTSQMAKHREHDEAPAGHPGDRQKYAGSRGPGARQLVSGGGRPSWLLITVTASSTGSLAASSRC